ncbi:hypothetical protein [Pseudomonas sp. PSB11]|uniref:hypothetical protein n=1 Tax=Pseudomonas sp. PSB11 TaxID=2021969 RepID=UPI001660BC38|nr:hypothetical protein [Pseudomonas sp. PSB11]
MNDIEILAIHKAQSRNVRHLKQVIKSFKRDINSDIRKSKKFQIETKTKLLALLYSAWSEAQFVQIAYTESGFSASEIKTLLKAKKNGITNGWIKMINLAFAKVGNPSTDVELGKRLNKLLGLVASQITKPSSIRNKVAHGQWVEALNGSLNKIDLVMTGDLNSLDSVQIMRQIEIHNYLGKIIRDLVQSPALGFGRDYLIHVTALEQYAAETQSWSVTTKSSELNKKPVCYNS